MAQSQSDLFDFVIQPNFDTNEINKQGKQLQQELEKLAISISDMIQKKMGSAFQFPANFNTRSISQVMELVTQLGGEFKRTGSTITATFKDADGVINTTVKSIEPALKAIEKANDAALQAGQISPAIAMQRAKKIEDYRASSATYTGTEQIKEQIQLEQQIIKALEDQYAAQKKIIDAQASGSAANQQYYTQVRDIAISEQNRLQNEYKGSQDNIKATEQRLQAEQKLYSTKVSNQQAEQAAAQAAEQSRQEQDQLEQKIIRSLEEQFTYQKKIIDAQNSGDKANEDYYTGLLDIAKGEEQIYQIQYNGSQSNIKAKKQEIAQEQQLYQKKSDSVKQENELVNAIKQYAKQYQTVRQLESKGQQGTQAYTDAKNALQQLTNILTTYGVQVVTSSDGTTKLVARQNSMADSSNKVKTALDNANGSLVKTDTAQNSLSQSIQSSVENFIKYQVAMEAINKITSEFTSAIYDMNEAMTQVRMVTMDSYEDTVALADSYTKLAKQLGTTTTTVAEGADAWLRQGYSAQDAMEMLKQSTTLAVVGQLNASEATDQLTA